MRNDVVIGPREYRDNGFPGPALALDGRAWIFMALIFEMHAFNAIPYTPHAKHKNSTSEFLKGNFIYRFIN